MSLKHSTHIDIVDFSVCQSGLKHK